MSKMYHFIICATLLFIATTRISGFHEKDSDEEAFQKFQKEYKRKSFRSADAQKRAFNYFKQNRDAIIAHNKLHDQGLVSYRLEINDRMDWSPEKQKRVNDYIPPSEKELQTMPSHLVSKSSKRANGPILGYQPFDWRDKGAVPPVRDQGGCGTCGLCAKTDAVASAYAIKNKSPAVALSVQAVVDCNYGNLSLTDPPDTPMFIMDNGIPTEADYPYMAGKDNYCIDPYKRSKDGYIGSCQMWNKKRVQPFVDRTDRKSWGVCAGCHPPSEAGMVDGIINGGPLVVGIASSCLGFSYYGSGIVYKSNCTNGVDHAVLLVGVGVQTVVSLLPNMTCQKEQVPYYIVKNSWGSGWGEGGYGKVAIGNKEVGLGSGGTYVSLTKPAPVPAPKINPSAWYYIVSDATGTVMDMSDSCSSSNCPIVANAKQPGQRQLWQIKPVPNTSYYTISSIAKNGQCLSLAQSDSQLVLTGCGDDLAKFSLQWNDNHTPAVGWSIVPKSQSSNAINLAGGNSQNNTPVLTWSNEEAVNDLWMFVSS